jgi:micrococcal nuclease
MNLLCRISAISGIALALLIGIFPLAYSSPATTSAYVVRVVDGSTLQVYVNDTTENVRIIGVDIPDKSNPNKHIKANGLKAEKFIREQLEGRPVYLQFDIQKRDKENHILAYVWISQPSADSDSELRDKLFNARLLLDGYARLNPESVNVKYATFLQRYQAEAQVGDRGLWDK